LVGHPAPAANGRLFAEFSTEGIDGLFTDQEPAAGPLASVLAKNLNRRHLDESQRGMVADNLATVRQGERTDLKSDGAEPVAEIAPRAFLSLS
jgi:hypothetical protein